MTSPDDTPDRPVPAVVALGANLGDRFGVLQSAVAALAAVEGVRVRAASAVFETDPVGPEQPDYLNAVLLLRTRLHAPALLAACQQVEDSHGRVRTLHWGPRTLDVDIVDYAGLDAATPVLRLPHPRAAERAFVLVPWLDVDPDAALATPAGVRRAADLLAGLPAADVAGVRPRPDLVLEVAT